MTKKNLPGKNFQLCVKGMATAAMSARNRQQVFYTDLTTFDLLIGQRTITCTLSRLMRTVKDTISLGKYVFLLNTPCSPDTSFRASTYHDSADTPGSWDRRSEYFGQQLSPYRPFWTSHRCANRTSAQTAPAASASNEQSQVWELRVLLLRLWAPQKLLIRLACPHVQHVHCLVV